VPDAIELRTVLYETYSHLRAVFTGQALALPYSINLSKPNLMLVELWLVVRATTVFISAASKSFDGHLYVS
jgi:hypothetical protein